MTPETLAAIDAAVTSVGDLWRSVPANVRYDLRQDMRQELALKLIQGKLGKDGLTVAARNWLRNALRDIANVRDIESQYANGAMKRYKNGENWLPTWYAPHADAEEHAPFAMRDARVMHCKPVQEPVRDVETATAEFFDSKYDLSESTPARTVSLSEGKKQR